VRGKQLALSFLFIGIAAALYVADSQRFEGRPEFSELELLLQKQGKASVTQLEKIFTSADLLVQDTLNRYKRKDSSYELLLQLGDAPKQLLYEGKKLKSLDFRQDAALFLAMERHLNARDPYSIYLRDNRAMFLVLGTFQGKPYVAAYDKDVFFASLANATGFRLWLVNASGVMLFHPQQRYIGADVTNFKQVSAGLASLQNGERREILNTYEGLDGASTLGVLNSIPEKSLLLGIEWAKTPAIFASTTTKYWFLFFFAVGIFFLSRSFLKNTHEDFPIENYKFDLERLDAKSKAILVDAQKKAEESVAHSKKVETELVDAVNGAAQCRADFLHAQMGLDFWNQFIDNFSTLPTGKQVWLEIAPLIYSQIGGSIMIYYRYSSTSFALVPELILGTENLAYHAQNYLNDARIFLGDFYKISEIKSNQAFQNWNKTRKRHMPLANDEAYFLPIEGISSSKGAYLILLEQNLANKVLLEKRVEFLVDFIRRITPLCELKQRLLQSKNGKFDPGPSVASAPNNA